jgi:hypothetical protein
LIKLAQLGSSVVTGVGEKDQISMAQDGHKIEHQQQKSLMHLLSGSTVHGTVPCDMSLVADNIQSKDQDGNSSKNFNHDLHTEDTAPYIDDVRTIPCR